MFELPGNLGHQESLTPSDHGSGSFQANAAPPQRILSPWEPRAPPPHPLAPPGSVQARRAGRSEGSSLTT